MKAIWLHTLIGRDLICMVSVRDISTAIRNLNEKDIALDFSGVEFATRSFKDELYNEIQKSKADGFNVTMKNMSDDLKTMYSAVSKTQKSGVKKVTMKTYSRPSSIAELEQIFASMSI